MNLDASIIDIEDTKLNKIQKHYSKIENANILEARWGHTGVGKNSQAIIFSGGIKGYLDIFLLRTEEYNGIEWSNKNADILIDRINGTSAGVPGYLILTGGNAFSTGINGGENVATSDKFNGTTWSRHSTNLIKRHSHQMTGTANYCICIGGWDDRRSNGFIKNVELMNSTVTWKAGPDLLHYIYNGTLVGVQNNCKAVGGDTYGSSKYNLYTSSFDGEKWKMDNISINTFKSGCSSNSNSAGSATITGGGEYIQSNRDNIIEDFDSVSWKIINTMITARRYHLSCSSGSTGLNVRSIGGQNNYNNLITVEQFVKTYKQLIVVTTLCTSNSSITAIDKIWKQINNPITYRRNHRDAGLPKYLITTGGQPETLSSQPLNTTDQFNGDSWKSSIVLLSKRFAHIALGKVNNAIITGGMSILGGSYSDIANKTMDLFNGDSWKTIVSVCPLKSYAGYCGSSQLFTVFSALGYSTIDQFNSVSLTWKTLQKKSLIESFHQYCYSGNTINSAFITKGTYAEPAVSSTLSFKYNNEVFSVGPNSLFSVYPVPSGGTANSMICISYPQTEYYDGECFYIHSKFNSEYSQFITGIGNSDSFMAHGTKASMLYDYRKDFDNEILGYIRTDKPIELY